MSLPRPHRLPRFTRLLAAGALLLGGLAAPAPAPVLAAPPLAPQGACGPVVNNRDHGLGSLRWTVGCVAAGATVTFSPSLTSTTILLTSGEIVISNSITIDGSGKPGLMIDGNNTDRVFSINAAGTVTLTHLTVQHGWVASGPGGAVVDGSGPLVLNQVQVLTSTAANGIGGGVAVDSDLTLTGTDVISNSSASNGGGVYATGRIVVTGGRFQRNTCTGGGCYGGGLFGNNTLTVTNTDFYTNTSDFNGGGVSTLGGAASLTGGHLLGNQCQAACLGGGVYVSGTLTLSGTQLISNTSALSGGGAYAQGNAVVSNARFERNVCTAANCQGGGLFAGVTASLSATDFFTNASAGHGGAVWIQTGLALVTNGTFQDNKCTGAGCQGGALNVDALALTGAHFIHNTSTGQGGGVWANSPASLTNALLQDNTCTGGGCFGGGVFAAVSLNLVGTDFINNGSNSHGGGAYATGPALLTNGRFQDNHCTDAACHAGGLYANASLTLTGTQFLSNTSHNSGGGAWVQSAVVLTGGVFQNNKCTGGCTGGGLFTSASLTLTATDFISNASRFFGGGVNVGGAVVLTGGRFERNISGDSGAGLYTSNSLTVSGTQFLTNTSGARGGGAYVTGNASLANALFQGNKCNGNCQGGGLFVSVGLTVTGTTFLSNTSTADGGGAWAQDAALANSQFQGNACTNADCLGGGLTAGNTATVLASSFSANQSAGRGGAIGITNSVAITLANVTLSGNSAGVSGGGLYAGGAASASLWNLTLAGNLAPSGGGLRVEPGVTAGVTNTIIANNTSDNCSGVISAGTHNLEFSAATCAAAGPSAGFTTADPRLAPLALNAPGASLTHALLPDSPARDQGDAAACAGPLVDNVDQRGVTRPLDSDHVPGAICDIGAFEAGPPIWTLFLSLISK